MAKKVKRVAKKAAKKNEGYLQSLLGRFLNKKNRPLHGVTLGSILVLLNSFWAVLAVIGWALIALSAVAFFTGKKKIKG